MQDEIIDEDAPFTVCQNTIIQDNSLSYFAIGIFIYLKSKPKDWKVIVKHLQKRNNTSEYAVRNGLRELRDAGYIKWIRVQSGCKYYISATGKYKNDYNNDEIHHVEIQHNEEQHDIYIQNKENNKINNNTKKNIKKENLNSILKTYNNQIEELISIFPKRLDITKNDIETAKRHIGRALLESSNKEFLLLEMKSGVDRYVVSLKDIQYCKKVNKWFGEASWTASYENVSEVQNTQQKPLLSTSKDDSNYFITVLNNELGAIIGYEWCEKYKDKHKKYNNRENLFALKDILQNEKAQDLSQIKNEFCLIFKNNRYSVFIEQANDEKMKLFFDELFGFIN